MKDSFEALTGSAWGAFLMRAARPFTMPVGCKHLWRLLGRDDVALLDVGCGNDMPKRMRFWFPRLEYHGVDRQELSQMQLAGRRVFDRFYRVDLERPAELAQVPDGYFDAINMEHLIEHLPDAPALIAALLPKLKKGGVLYVEFPSVRSTRLPRMRGTLNFYDDPTHLRVYTRAEVAEAVVRGGARVVAQGVRRDPWKILAMPVWCAVSLATLGYVAGGCFWDLFGFAEYVCART